MGGRLQLIAKVQTINLSSFCWWLSTGADYVLQLIAFGWDMACIRSSPDPSLSCGSGSGLRD